MSEQDDYPTPQIVPLYGAPTPPVQDQRYIVLTRAKPNAKGWETIWFAGGKPSAAFGYAMLCMEEGDRLVHYDPEGLDA